MRKLIFATALAIGSLSAMAAASALEENGIELTIVEEFKEIPVDQLPEAVTVALASEHSGAVISKAYVDENEHYKLEVTTEEGSSVTLYADSEGNWLELD